MCPFAFWPAVGLKPILNKLPDESLKPPILIRIYPESRWLPEVMVLFRRGWREEELVSEYSTFSAAENATRKKMLLFSWRFSSTFSLSSGGHRQEWTWSGIHSWLRQWAIPKLQRTSMGAKEDYFCYCLYHWISNRSSYYHKPFEEGNFEK